MTQLFSSGSSFPFNPMNSPCCIWIPPLSHGGVPQTDALATTLKRALRVLWPCRIPSSNTSANILVAEDHGSLEEIPDRVILLSKEKAANTAEESLAQWRLVANDPVTRQIDCHKVDPRLQYGRPPHLEEPNSK